jgi:hypothetical protein
MENHSLHLEARKVLPASASCITLSYTLQTHSFDTSFVPFCKGIC